MKSEPTRAEARFDWLKVNACGVWCKFRGGDLLSVWAEVKKKRKNQAGISERQTRQREKKSGDDGGYNVNRAGSSAKEIRIQESGLWKRERERKRDDAGAGHEQRERESEKLSNKAKSGERVTSEYYSFRFIELPESEDYCKIERNPGPSWLRPDPCVCVCVWIASPVLVGEKSKVKTKLSRVCARTRPTNVRRRWITMQILRRIWIDFANREREWARSGPTSDEGTKNKRPSFKEDAQR